MHFVSLLVLIATSWASSRDTAHDVSEEPTAEEIAAEAAKAAPQRVASDEPLSRRIELHRGEDGAFDGAKVSGLSDAGRARGLMEGDIIQKIGSASATDTTSLMKALQELQPNTPIVVLRAGKTITLGGPSATEAPAAKTEAAKTKPTESSEPSATKPATSEATPTPKPSAPTGGR